MRKFNIITISLLSLSLLGACSNSNSSDRASSDSSKSSSLKAKESSIKKAKAELKKKESSIKKAQSESKKAESEKEASENTSATNSQQVTQQKNSDSYQTQTSTPIKSQSQINMERGYDPKGNPVMPGQDHAPGSDIYGNPDSWVQGQIDWAKSQGMIDSNGNETENFKNWVSQRDNAWDNGQDDFPDYDQNRQW